MTAADATKTHHATNTANVSETVIACIRKLLPRRMKATPLTHDQRLSDLGFDSMKLLELVFLLQDAFQWQGEEVELGRHRITTIADVIETSERLLTQSAR